MIALEKDRTVSEGQGEHRRIADVDLPEGGRGHVLASFWLGERVSHRR